MNMKTPNLLPQIWSFLKSVHEPMLLDSYSRGNKNRTEIEHVRFLVMCV